MRRVTAAELAMEKWTDRLWTRLLPAREEDCDVVAILRRDCDENALILDRERVLVPNSFVVELPSAIHSQLESSSGGLVRQLAVQVRRHAAEQGYVFAGPVAVQLHASDCSTIGRFRVYSRIAPLSPGGPGRAGGVPRAGRHRDD